MAADRNEHIPQNTPGPVETGNASNPSPRPDDEALINDNRQLSGEAEKYLREVASIEDLPDPQDQQDMDRTIEEENGKK